MDATSPDRVRIAQLLAEHSARERAEMAQMRAAFEKALAERARQSAAHVCALQGLEPAQEGPTETDATPAPATAVSRSPATRNESALPSGWSPLDTLPPLTSPGQDLLHEIHHPLASPAGPPGVTDAAYACGGGFNLGGFGNTANLSGGFGNVTNMTFNGGPPVAPGAPAFLRENTAELRQNTAAVRDLSASLGGIITGADMNDDGADPAPPDQEDDMREPRDATSPPAQRHRRSSMGGHHRRRQGPRVHPH